MRVGTEDQVDLKRLWELAKEGKSAQEMMKTLNLRDMESLKRSLDKLFREKGETVHVPGLIGRASVEGKHTRSGARIDPQMMGKPDLGPEDQPDRKEE
ncbi:MAG: hypothetical protein R6U50_03695 [Desulfobacterales bacterium]